MSLYPPAQQRANGDLETSLNVAHRLMTAMTNPGDLPECIREVGLVFPSNTMIFLGTDRHRCLSSQSQYILFGMFFRESVHLIEHCNLRISQIERDWLILLVFESVFSQDLRAFHKSFSYIRPLE